MLKERFEYIVSLYSISDNIIYNNLIMTCIGALSFVISYNIVGRMYRIGLIDGRIAGKILHWSIRLVVFFILYNMAKMGNGIYELISQGSVYSWLILPIIILLIFITSMILFYIRKNITKY